jgi:hypothetical protein
VDEFGLTCGVRHGNLVFKKPWPSDPRVNIHNVKSKAKPYQVRQALEAIEQ